MRFLLLALLPLAGCGSATEPSTADVEPVAPSVTERDVVRLGDVEVRYVDALPPGPEPRSVPWFPNEEGDPTMHATCDCTGDALRVLAMPGGYQKSAAALALCLRGQRWEVADAKIGVVRDDVMPPRFGTASGTVLVLQQGGCLELAVDLRSGSVGSRGRFALEPDACEETHLDLWLSEAELTGCR